MYQRTSNQPPKFLMHAEVTISHPNVTVNPGVAHTEHSDRGVRMTYSWRSSPIPENLTAPQQATSTTTPSSKPVPSTSYGFQRGNILFTSTPPNASTKSRINDSGYNSEHFRSPSIATTQSINQKQESYKRKCQSTCSIVLSTDIDDGGGCVDTGGGSDSIFDSVSTTNCNRTQSLRCQHPTRRCGRTRGSGHYYGCGDPWCYHSTYAESSRFSPVPESCEEWSTTDKTSNITSNTFIKKPAMQDAAAQTIEMKDQSTSPMFKSALFTPFSPSDLKSSSKTGTEKAFTPGTSGSKLTRKKYDSRHKSEPIISTRYQKQDRFGETKSKNLARPSDNNSNESEHKPRTVHIDVYCTGSDIDSDSSSSSSSTNSDKDVATSASTPQTVYENNELRISHKRIHDKQTLPASYLKRFPIQRSPPQSNLSSFASTSQLTKHGSSLFSESSDGISSLYPSQKSSYSTINEFDSSASNIPQSWSSTMSTSSCTLPDYESVSTSWKDTVSDFEPLFPLTQTSTPSNVLSTDVSTSSIVPSDSFEYADSSDRLRIKRMEEMWAQSRSRTKLEPTTKHVLQQQKINEYIEKHLANRPLPKWQETELSNRSESTNESEIDWSNSLKRGETVRRISKEDAKNNNISTAQPERRSSVNRRRTNNTSDLLARAQMFGTTLGGSSRRLGHHAGPVRNPCCTCEHCTTYYSEIRGRTRSVGDMPAGTINWKKQLTPTDFIRLETKNPDYTDF